MVKFTTNINSPANDYCRKHDISELEHRKEMECQSTKSELLLGIVIHGRKSSLFQTGGKLNCLSFPKCINIIPQNSFLTFKWKGTESVETKAMNRNPLGWRINIVAELK